MGTDPLKDPRKVSERVVFIGGGNMATSLVGGLVANGYPGDLIAVVDINADRLQTLAEQFSVATFVNFEDCINSADTVVLAVKPQSLRAVCENISACLASRSPLFISIAAGIRSVDIDRWLGGGRSVVRAMPNTPALLKVGASGLFANANVKDGQRQHTHDILSATGLALWVDSENDIDIVTALSGSGPAYIFQIIESMIKAAVALGLPVETARQLTLQTAFGAAKMALESDDDVSLLRERVTSPGGTTEQGLRMLNEKNIDNILFSVLDAARKRSVELADQLGED